MASTNNGYFTNGGSPVQVTLPSTSVVGDTFIVTAMNSNGWQILEGLGQQIELGNQATTLTSGSLASTAIGDTVELTCNVANLSWFATRIIGNITVV